MAAGSGDIGGGSCAELLKALADETRLAVVQQLIDGARHVHEVNAPLQLEPSLLSHHLRVLRSAGIVEARRDGKAVLYRLSPGVEARRQGNALDLGCCQIVFRDPVRRRPGGRGTPAAEERA